MGLKVDTLPLDCRGEIHQLECKGVKVNLIYSKAGSLRSGDIHPNNQYDYVIKGQVIIQVESTIVELQGGREIMVPTGKPHLFLFVEDTWLLEWWDGPFAAEYYPPMRQYVDKYIKENTKDPIMENYTKRMLKGGIGEVAPECEEQR